MRNPGSEAKPRFNLTFLKLLMVFAVIIGSAGLAPGVELSEGWQQDLSFQERARIAALIRAFNAPYAKRRPVVRKVIALESGPTKAIVYEYLVSSLKHNNSQIRGGTVETMARIGDPRYVTAIAAEMPYEMTIDVRLLGVSFLPIFLIQNDEIRNEMLELLYDASFRMTDRLELMLRDRQLTKDGQDLNPALARLRRDITIGLARQLDPGHLDERLAVELDQRSRGRNLIAVRSA